MLKMQPYIRILPYAINSMNDNLEDDTDTSPLYHVIVSQDKLKMMFLVVKRDEAQHPPRIYDTVKCEYLTLHGIDERDKYLELVTASTISADCTIVKDLFKSSLQPYGIDIKKAVFHDFEFFESDLENKGFSFADPIKYEALKNLINKRCSVMMSNPRIRE